MCNMEQKTEKQAVIITVDDLLMGRAGFHEIPIAHQNNLTVTAERMSVLASNCPYPIKINDGYRRPQDQPKNAALGSLHLVGAAMDADDDDTAYLWRWTFGNLDLLQKIGLWIEDPRWTHGHAGTWMHYQIFPPRSGNRIFVPNTASASAARLWDGKYDAVKYRKLN